MSDAEPPHSLTPPTTPIARINGSASDTATAEPSQSDAPSTRPTNGTNDPQTTADDSPPTATPSTNGTTSREFAPAERPHTTTTAPHPPTPPPLPPIDSRNASIRQPISPDHATSPTCPRSRTPRQRQISPTSAGRSGVTQPPPTIPDIPAILILRDPPHQRRFSRIPLMPPVQPLADVREQRQLSHTPRIPEHLHIMPAIRLPWHAIDPQRRPDIRLMPTIQIIPITPSTRTQV